MSGAEAAARRHVGEVGGGNGITDNELGEVADPGDGAADFRTIEAMDAACPPLDPAFAKHPIEALDPIRAVGHGVDIQHAVKQDDVGHTPTPAGLGGGEGGIEPDGMKVDEIEVGRLLAEPRGKLARAAIAAGFVLAAIPRQVFHLHARGDIHRGKRSGSSRLAMVTRCPRAAVAAASPARRQVGHPPRLQGWRSCAEFSRGGGPRPRMLTFRPPRPGKKDMSGFSFGGSVRSGFDALAAGTKGGFAYRSESERLGSAGWPLHGRGTCCRPTSS